MKTASMGLAAAACAMMTMTLSVSSAGADTHWRNRLHTDRFHHGCRTSRADRYVGGRHIWRYRRDCR